MRSVFEHSAGVIPFRRGESSPLLYLVIHSATVRNPQARWEFPKGGIERGESPRQAAAREFHEETGLSAWAFRDGFEQTVSYTYLRFGEKRHKTVTYFIAEVLDGSKMRCSREHMADGFGHWYHWAPIESIARLLCHTKSRYVLTEADAFLRNAAWSPWIGEGLHTHLDAACPVAERGTNQIGEQR